MKPNLDKLKPEIENYLKEAGLALFYGYSRSVEPAPAVYWDCDGYPDFRGFIETAQSVDAKLIVFHQREFQADQIEDALERLAACELPSEDARNFEERIHELRAYEGSICSVELSFDHQGRVFLFDLRTDWFEELTDMLDEIELLTPEAGEDDTPMSGYFSRN
ncbi:MAG TPA: hypothetical protein VMB25_06045 [Bryobacteraceae bacterium]|nr:hypothetical protein [Bryobacteraceae bacterium]